MKSDEGLEVAVRVGNLRGIKHALRKGADPNLCMTDEGRSILCLAASSGNARIVQALIEAGAKPGSEKAGTTSLHAAAEAGDVKIVEWVLNAGGKGLLNRFDARERTPLMCAVERGSMDVVRTLLEAGADVNARANPRASNTALRIAAGEGMVEMARLLLDYGADPLFPGRLMLTPLDRARERHTPEGRLIAHFITKTLEAREEQARHSRGKKRR